MINGFLHKKQDLISRIVVSGHAGYASEGQDIVCASVSVLVINTINAIEKFTDAKFSLIQDEGMIDINFSYIDFKAKLLVDTLELGIKDISVEYGKYVKLSYRR